MADTNHGQMVPTDYCSLGLGREPC